MISSSLRVRPWVCASACQRSSRAESRFGLALGDQHAGDDQCLPLLLNEAGHHRRAGRRWSPTAALWPCHRPRARAKPGRHALLGAAGVVLFWAMSECSSSCACAVSPRACCTRARTSEPCTTETPPLPGAGQGQAPGTHPVRLAPDHSTHRQAPRGRAAPRLLLSRGSSL